MRILFRPLIKLIVLSAFGVFILHTQTAFALTGGIGGKPANPDPKNPRSASIFVYTLGPGSSKQDQVRISNNSDKTQTIELYAVDGTTTNTGSLACRQQVEAKDDVGAWASLSQGEVTLNPKQDTVVDFSIAVPTHATPGEHDGCLVFQQKDDEGQVSGNIRIRTRQALRIAITATGDIHKSIHLASFDVSQANGLNLGLMLKNSGNVSADTNVQAVVRTVFGNTVYHNGGSYPVFGGKNLQLQFVDSKKSFWGGVYIAQATIQYDKRPGVFGLADKNQLVTVRSSRHLVFIWPSPVVTVCLVLLIFGAGWYIVQRKKQRRELLQSQKDWQEYHVKTGDTIETIAATHGTSWQQLARVNRLQAPYQISKGVTIKVPTKPHESPHHKKAT